jgi:hypothetical protein
MKEEVKRNLVLKMSIIIICISIVIAIVEFTSIEDTPPKIESEEGYYDYYDRY